MRSTFVFGIFKKFLGPKFSPNRGSKRQYKSHFNIRNVNYMYYDMIKWQDNFDFNTYQEKRPALKNRLYIIAIQTFLLFA